MFTYPYKVQFLVKQTLAVLLHELMTINVEYFMKCTLKRLYILFLFRMLRVFYPFFILYLYNNNKTERNSVVVAEMCPKAEFDSLKCCNFDRRTKTGIGNEVLFPWSDSFK